MAEYLLVDRQQHPGRNHVIMWRYTWYCLEDGLFYETTVDRTFRNWARSGWQELSTDPAPWGIYTNLRRTRKVTREGMPVITADSHPRLHSRTTRDEAIEIVAVDQGRRAGRINQFGDLFACNHS